jgi:hypothetical protein
MPCALVNAMRLLCHSASKQFQLRQVDDQPLCIRDFSWQLFWSTLLAGARPLARLKKAA